MELNSDILERVIEELNAADADAYELHDFMATSKQIYEMTSGWRKCEWSFGNIILKPYQVEMFYDSYLETYFTHEDKELNKLIQIIHTHKTYCGETSIFFTQNPETIRQSAEKYGVVDKLVFIDNLKELTQFDDNRINYNRVDTISEFLKDWNKLHIVSSYEKEFADLFIEYSFTDDERLNHCSFTDDPTSADHITIRRSEYYAPKVEHIDVIDFELNALKRLVDKLFETKPEIQLLTNSDISCLTPHIVIHTDSILYESDPNYVPRMKKVYVGGKSRITFNTIITHNFDANDYYLNQKSRFKRNITVYNLTDNIYRYLNKRLASTKFRIPSLCYGEFHYAILRMLGGATSLSNGDLAILFAKGDKQGLYNYWLSSRNNKLCDEQVRAFLEI